MSTALFRAILGIAYIVVGVVWIIIMWSAVDGESLTLPLALPLALAIFMGAWCFSSATSLISAAVIEWRRKKP